MPQVTDSAEISKKLKCAQLLIWKELDRVCGLLGLTYCFAFGSSLGAKRHKGFIPWDDDIDVYMKIDELEILQKNANLFKENFFLQHRYSDSDYGLMITRLRNSNTTLIEKNEAQRNINHGIFIDIYPLFNTPKGGLMAKHLVIISMIYRLMLYGVVPKNRGIIMKIGSFVLLKIVPLKLRNYIIKKFYSIIKNTKPTGYLSSLYGDEQNIRYPEDWFFPVQWVPFESVLVPVQADQDQYLSFTYGDYMKLPPKDKQVFHHDYSYIDFENSYLNYKGKYYCKE